VAPILAVPGLRERLAGTRVPVIAVSPIIGGAAVKGPAAKIMRELDLPVSPLEIAREYGDFLDLMLIDDADQALVESRGERDPAVDTAAILMRTPEDRMRLAAECLKRLI
jgi:LPPG:FO 2-phospho-L-lactate transferase